MRLVARLVRAGDRAIGAADAQVVVDRDDAVGALLRRGGRADVHAGRIVAVLAADRHERAAHVRVFAEFHVEHAPPLDARRRRVGVAARRGARLAADAAAQVGNHGPARHCAVSTGETLTRTMSAPDPVASVRSIDIVDSEFMLGMPKSFVNGVAQWSNWPEQEQRVRADALAQHGPPAHAVLRRRDLDLRAVRDAELPRRLRIDDHAAVALHVVGDLLDELHADVGAPRVLHAARGEQPERIVRGSPPGLHERRRSTARRSPCTPAAPGTRAAACPTSACRARAAGGRARRRCAAGAPGRGARSAGPSLRASGTGTTWSAGTALVARPFAFHQARSCASRAVRHLGARRAAHRVPDRFRRVRDVSVGERHSPSARP